MRHKFSRLPILEGEEYLLLECENKCGTKIKKYRNGSIMYLNPKTGGALSGKNAPKCKKDIIEESIEKSEESVVIVRDIDKKNSLTQYEANLKDALTIINLLYRDLVSYSINSRSRYIAKRFLESHEYKEVVKDIESKTST